MRVMSSIVFVMLIGNVACQQPTVSTEQYGRYVYVYDRQLNVWNRATKEDLQKAACDELRMYEGGHK